MSRKRIATRRKKLVWLVAGASVITAGFAAATGAGFASQNETRALPPPTIPSSTACANGTAVAVVLDNFERVENAANNRSSDGLISHDDLVAAGQFLNGRSLQVQSAANHILRTPGLEARVASAALDGAFDTNISRSDLRNDVVEEILGSIDDLLDEIDDVIEENALAFVREYCGNGGS